jgi:hypothetical protein
MVVGAWCFLILVLLNVYNGTLISYVMQTGRALPLLTSSEDAAESNVLLVVNKGLGPDIFLSVRSCKFEILISFSVIVIQSLNYRRPKANFTKRWVTNCVLILNRGVIPHGSASNTLNLYRINMLFWT